MTSLNNGDSGERSDETAEMNDLIREAWSLTKNKQYDQAFNIVNKLDGMDIPVVDYYIGSMYAHGHGVIQNFDVAKIYLLRCYPHLSLNDKYQIGNSFHVMDDEKKAYEIYKELADAGHAKACSRISAFYDRGIGTPVDKDMARVYFKKAAECGEPFAMRSYAKQAIKGKFGLWQIIPGLIMLPKAMKALLPILSKQIEDGTIKRPRWALSKEERREEDQRKEAQRKEAQNKDDVQ